MLWEDYYDKFYDWATSTAVSRLSQLESFGPPEEIIEIIESIALDDEKGATRLLKKATAAGVKFTGQQLADIVLICDEKVLIDAVRSSASHFTAEDLEALYCDFDDDLLIDLAKKHRIPLPEDLAEPVEEEYDPAEDVEPPLTAAELAVELDYIMDCLHRAFEQLKGGQKFSLMDMHTKDRSFTVVKYSYLANAQPHIENAIEAWAMLDFPGKDEHLLDGIRLNISNKTMWRNYIFDLFGLNFSVQRQIYNVIKKIEHAYKSIQRLRDDLW